MKSKHSKKKKWSIGKKVVISILLIILFVLISTGTYLFSRINNVHKEEMKKDNKSLDIDSNLKYDDEIINIALLGVDERKGDPGRSDATMVFTIDKKHNKLKLTSFYRDSYVDIDGVGKTKLNHAYAYGRGPLAVKTLNKNFGLDIKDYVRVNFSQLADVIDELGGVDITIKDYEVEQVNQYIKNVGKETGKTGEVSSITAGKQHLNGVQAVGYSRVRYAGNQDMERTERQRTVLTEIFNKVKSAGITEYPGIVNKLLPHVSTSMSNTDIISLGMSILSSGMGNIEQEAFPVKGKRDWQTIDGVGYFVFDKEETKKLVRDYIYNDIKPQ